MDLKMLFVLMAYASMVLSSCGGGQNEPAKSPAAPAVPSAPISGEAVFKNTCFACHQTDGKGIPNTYPPLAQSDFIADREATITQVIKGKSGEITVNGVKYNNVMPPQPLKDEEIAAVLTYVYSHFGNSGAPVTTDEVKAVRAKLP